jgi:CHASE1-domain containing sensor protein
MKVSDADLETGTYTDTVALVDGLPILNSKDNDKDAGDTHSVGSNNSSVSLQELGRGFATRTNVIALLISLVGLAAGAIILGAGIQAAEQDQKLKFDRLANELMQQFHNTIDDYFTAGLWTHQAAFRTRDTMTPADFRVAYEYLNSTGLELQAAAFVTKVEGREERERLENRTRLYLKQHYPNITYQGFTGFNSPEDIKPQPRDEADFYYAIMALEPFEDVKNRAALSFDTYTSPPRRAGLLEAKQTYKPALTERLKLIQEGFAGTASYAYSVILVHPGIPLSNATPPQVHEQSQEPRDFTFTVMRVPDTLIRTRQNFPGMENQHVSLYIYDSTATTTSDTTQGKPPAFLGGGMFHSDTHMQEHPGEWVTFSNEVELADLKVTSPRYLHERRIPIASREWTFVVLAPTDAFQPSVTFVALGATMVVVACWALAFWMVSNHRKMTAMNRLKARTDSEKAHLMISNAREAAQKERELNDFLSHEVNKYLQKHTKGAREGRK